MSGKRLIKFEIDEVQISELKREIREFIKEEVSIEIGEQLIEKEPSEKLEELREMVQDTFTRGTDLTNNLTTGRNRSHSPTTQTAEELDVKEVCRKTLEGVWVQEVAVMCLDEGEEFPEDHRILQKGILVDRGTGWKFDFCIFKKSRRLKLEKGKSYVIGPVVSSVYEGSTEFHLNAKTHIQEAEV